MPPEAWERRAGSERTSGSVDSLWRYPVKSMLGERLETVNVSGGGLPGDRSHALVDLADGKVVSAKNPRKWARLFEFEAVLDPPAVAGDLDPVWINFPDGTGASSKQEDIDRLLSAELGSEVSLRNVAHQDQNSVHEYERPSTGETAARGTFFDAAVVHVLTTATLDFMAKLYPQGRFDVRRFRPNIVLEVGGEGTVEDEWLGRTICVGDGVRLEVVDPCPRCVMVTLPQRDLSKDPGILRATVEGNGGNAGVYATVLRGGRIGVGDRISLE